MSHSTIELSVVLAPFINTPALLSLACTCKSIFTALAHYINQVVLFRYAGVNNKFQWHHPQKLRVGGYFGAMENPSFLSPINLLFDVTLLPPTLTHLTFGTNFNQPVAHLLPRSITHLSFGKCFNQPVDFLPPKLIRLLFGERFDHPVDNILPQSIFFLFFGTAFNQTVCALPPKLTHLYLEGRFNQPVLSLPITLTHLHLGHLFHQDISWLPRSLIVLKFNTVRVSVRIMLSSIPSPLPPKLTTFHILTNSFTAAILPESLTDLQCYCYPEIPFPPNLLHLSFWPTPEQLARLPFSLSTLKIVYYSRLPSIDIPPLPSNLQELEVGHGFNLPPSLPPSISHLSLRSVTHSTALPPTLTHLTLAVGMGKLASLPLIYFKTNIINNPLPFSLKVLDIQFLANSDFLPPLLEQLSIESSELGGIATFPFCLRNLHLGNFYSEPLPPFPPHLTELEIGSSYNHSISRLPLHLQTLKIGNRYNHPLPSLPPSLTFLKIGHTPLTSGFYHPFPSFPPSLTHLELLTPKAPYNQPSFPPFLKHLRIITSSPLPPLPLTLEYVEINPESTLS